MSHKYTKDDWRADYLRAGALNDQRLTLLSEAREYESLGMLTEAKHARDNAKEYRRAYKEARAEADRKFFGQRTQRK